MIALYIILGILLLLFLLILIKVEIFAVYSDELSLTLKVLFYRIVLLPSKPKPKKKEEPKKEPEKKPTEQPEDKKEKKQKQSYLTKLKNKKGLTGVLSLLTGVARIAAGTLKGLLSHVVIHKMDVGIALSSDDSSSTAVNYGRLCSIVYPAVDVISAATVCKSYRVTLEPVFDDEKKTRIYVDVHAHLRICFAVAEAIKAGVKLLLVRLRL